MSDYDLSIHTNPDAMSWAELFVKTTRDMPRENFDDAGYMVSWFANAMMAMHDHLHGAGPLNGDHAQYLLDKAEGVPDRGGIQASAPNQSGQSTSIGGSAIQNEP